MLPLGKAQFASHIFEKSRGHRGYCVTLKFRGAGPPPSTGASDAPWTPAAGAGKPATSASVR